MAATYPGERNPNWRGGKSSHPLNWLYEAMLSRCRNANNNQWVHYGGRGIKVCDRWLDDFWNFVEDMGERPMQSNGRWMVLDRIDNDGDYTPQNCRWTTDSVSSSNRRHETWTKPQRPRGANGKYVKWLPSD